MANTVSGAADERGPKSAKGEARGFFTVYKSGQGYWTRMGTVLGVTIIGLFTAHFLYEQLPAFGVMRSVTLGVVAAFVIAYVLILFKVLNKPDNVDFLIATDSEMKKVNWSTRRELVGSTKVVIVITFLIAIILFVYDIIFGMFFHLIGVLQYSPFHR